MVGRLKIGGPEEIEEDFLGVVDVFVGCCSCVVVDVEMPKLSFFGVGRVRFFGFWVGAVVVAGSGFVVDGVGTMSAGRSEFLDNRAFAGVAMRERLLDGPDMFSVAAVACETGPASTEVLVHSISFPCVAVVLFVRLDRAFVGDSVGSAGVASSSGSLAVASTSTSTVPFGASLK